MILFIYILNIFYILMTHNTKIIEKEIVEQKLDVPEEELEEYKDAFNLFDKDGKGYITRKEFGKALKNLGQTVSAEDLDKIMLELDSDGSGQIEFPEFVTYMQKTKVTEEVEDEDEIIKAFMNFDKDNKNYITCREFKYVLCSLGKDNKFTDEEAEELFKEADLDKDGKLQYREFVEFWRNV